MSSMLHLSMEEYKRDEDFRVQSYHSFGTDESLVVYTSKSKVPADHHSKLNRLSPKLPENACQASSGNQQLTWITQKRQEGYACCDLQHALFCQYEVLPNVMPKNGNIKLTFCISAILLST